MNVVLPIRRAKLRNAANNLVKIALKFVYIKNICTFVKFIQKSINHKESATVLTAIYNNPTGYGRIVRDIGGGRKQKGRRKTQRT